MKGRFWRKALAAALALLVVSGNVPIRSVADLFGGAAITASALESEASGQCGENATWVYDRATGTLTISGTGDIGSVGWADYKDEIAFVIIGDGITSICDSAFAFCNNLTSVEIPDSVENIGDSAFEWCGRLESVNIPDSVTSIGSDAFSDCTGLTSVNIPDSVTYIGNYAFFGCEGLTSVTIPDSVTHIGDYAFKNCESLTSVEIPDSVESIGDHAFEGCEGLTSVNIPDSVTYIGKDAFYLCTGITEVHCDADPANLTWNDGYYDDFKDDGTTVCHVPAEYLSKYVEKFGDSVNVTFVGDMGLGEHLYGHSITLDGSIGVNFYVELTDALLASETAEMVFTIPNGSKTDTQTLLVKDAVQKQLGGKTYYVFKCNVSAKDMASEITAQMFDGDKAGTEYKYSVKDYAEYLLENTEGNAEYANAAPLVKAMLNYGAASQTYFSIEGTAANASLTDADKALDNVTIPAKFEYDDNASLPTGVTFEGATLSLRSETTLSLYFKGLPAETVFTCDGKTVETAKNGEYVVARIRGIKASELENNFTVTFDEDGRVTYNAMTYCYNVLNDDTVDDNLQNVCKALYQYAQAAKTYSE